MISFRKKTKKLDMHATPVLDGLVEDFLQGGRVDGVFSQRDALFAEENGQGLADGGGVSRLGRDSEL